MNVEDARLLLDHAAVTGKELDPSLIEALMAGPEHAAFALKYAELARVTRPGHGRVVAGDR